MSKTVEWDTNIDFGLSFKFDGKAYNLFLEYCSDEYSIGSMACELCRLRPTEIKQIIMNMKDTEKEADPDTFTDAFMRLYRKLPKEFPPIIATMVITEFQAISIEWFDAVRTNRVDEYLEPFNTNDSVAEYILSDTGYEKFGGDTVLQLLLTCYMAFANSFVAAKHIFEKVLSFDEQNDDEREKNMDAWLRMYADFMKIQKIDYRIILTEKGFESLYTIRSSLSLVLFELAQILNIGANIVKCKNCGNFFVPTGRSDSVYCSYPLMGLPEKTCRDVGAAVTRANKEKNDIATREYRKKYMRYKMKLRRDQKSPTDERMFIKLTSEVKEWRSRMKDGTATVDEFIDWLKQF